MLSTSQAQPEIMKEIGSPAAAARPRPGNPRQWVATTAVGDPTIPTVRPPGSGKSPNTPTLKTLVAPPASINGKIHDEADCTGGQELQIVIRGIGHTGNYCLANPALVCDGRHSSAARHHIF